VQGRGLAFASLPHGALAHRLVRVRLERGAHFTGEGYAGATTADLTLTLSRLSVRSRIVREQLPVGF
jgi:hypothetical protein